MAPWGLSAGYVEKNRVLLILYNSYNDQEEEIWNCWVSIFEWHTLQCSSSVINIVNWCFSYINIIKPQSKKSLKKNLWSVLQYKNAWRLAFISFWTQIVDLHDQLECPKRSLTSTSFIFPLLWLSTWFLLRVRGVWKLHTQLRGLTESNWGNSKCQI